MKHEAGLHRLRLGLGPEGTFWDAARRLREAVRARLADVKLYASYCLVRELATGVGMCCCNSRDAFTDWPPVQGEPS